MSRVALLLHEALSQTLVHHLILCFSPEMVLKQICEKNLVNSKLLAQGTILLKGRAVDELLTNKALHSEAWTPLKAHY